MTRSAHAEKATRKALAALNALPFAARHVIASSLEVGSEGLVFLPAAGICLLARQAEDRFTIRGLSRDGAVNYLLALREEERAAETIQ